MSLCAGSSSATFSIGDDYKKINTYLVSSVASDDPVENVAAARQYLAQVTAKNDNPFFKRSLIIALQNFVALPEVLSEEMCNMKTYSILHRNSLGTKSVTNKPVSQLARTPMRRVDIVLHQFAMEHALECKTVYPQLWRAFLGQIEPAVVERVDLFTNNVLHSSWEFYQRMRSSRERAKAQANAQAEYIEFTLEHVGSLDGEIVAQAAYDTLYEHAHNGPERAALLRPIDPKTGKPVKVNKSQVGALFEQYIVQPCAAYVQTLGNVFLPASYDANQFELHERYDLADAQYYAAWSRFKLCNRLVAGKEHKTLLKALLKLLASERMVAASLKAHAPQQKTRVKSGLAGFY